MLNAEPIKTRVMVRTSQTGEVLPFIDSFDIKASSHGAPWDDLLAVEHDLLPASEMKGGYIERTTIVQPLVKYDVPAFRLEDQRHTQPTSLRNVIHIDPSGSLTGARWTKPANVLFLMPSDTVFERVIEDMAKTPSRLELTRASFIQDIHIQQIGNAILTECQEGFPSGRLYGESLAMALTARLVNNYSVRHLHTNDTGLGLPSWRLRKVIDFIERNIDADLGLEDLANLAGFSEFHFSRMFKKSTGFTPHRYVTERRIARAKELLLRTQMPIKDISNQLGFGDQAHLSTVFKRLTGTTPKRFREQNK
ncbi:AraC family transcriptional regulator [Marinobacter pelagius]|uniref:helix-turn-helix domain-containing protein n=1 Tax=Marinobacter sp. C7 TaxID=2951363 RepID=UPI001EF06A10|nr:AraC family transcriptional regulator [Marinobacter sp. C7]MCG7201471.1 AraC family transcriptional regulator [Marinobacter sp. C7]